MDYTFYVIIILLAIVGAVEVTEYITYALLPVLGRARPLSVKLEGTSAEYQLRRAIRDAKRQRQFKIIVSCADEDSQKICRILEIENPWLEFVYTDSVLTCQEKSV